MTFFKTPLTSAMPSHDLCPSSRHPAFMKSGVGIHEVTLAHRAG